jgi:hypothetical protein
VKHQQRKLDQKEALLIILVKEGDGERGRVDEKLEQNELTKDVTRLESCTQIEKHLRLKHRKQQMQELSQRLFQQ